VPALISGLLVVALGAYGYSAFRSPNREHVVPAALQEATASPLTDSPSTTFRCDGRIHCSQMTSCAEAKFFLAHCPGTLMDGNNDGVPCEQQWCTSPFAK
jgi:hypothetical protein